MAGAFLADTLREQAAAELRGQMLQGQIAKQVARQIVGQVAQQEIGQSIGRLGGKGRALGQAAGQEMRRDLGKTQLEMQKDAAQKAKTMGLITGAASAIGSLGAHFALQKPEAPAAQQFKAPATELAAMDFEERFTEGLTPSLVPERAQVASLLDAEAPDEFLAAPLGALEVPSASPLNPGQYHTGVPSEMEKEEIERQLRAAQGGVDFGGLI